ncbi:MAG: insulinase family protein [Nitrospinaceae bacterium]|jgi:predicted Zn-dependent peptidase|nr:insulinase family protein [Nitrospinaceae bacterium]MBT3433972.1 insulinase family protein [Nitrospinaceae bacterium]MBT4093159.1 insulinase family protein [Nitrospinaceae bacterium]MBT4429160.1 insulinase family protein [Nitrospinaceae bacterium]MBT5367626.1 insulinase family protein [Nitrospinaceae bacterium]
MKISQGKLSNGVRVVTTELSDSAAVAFHIYFGCGGRHERDEVVGVSHALEHMIFKGTPTRSTLDIAREMEGNGAAINANTGSERTCYHFKAPADVFETVLDVYADAVNNALLDVDEWHRERNVILEELKMYEDMPRAWVSEMLETMMFNLQVGVIGSKETINAIEPEHMRELIRDWYTPGNTVVSVSGGVPHDEVMRLSEKFFGQRTGAIDQDESPALPTESKGRYIEQVRQTDQVNLAIGFRAFGVNHDDAPALRLLCDILGGKMSSRLFTEVREKRGLAYSVGAHPSRFSDAGFVEIKAGVALDKAKEATEVSLAEAARMKNETVGAEELAEAKQHIRGNLQINESSDYYAGRNGSSLLIRGKLYTVEEEITEINAVTAEDIQRVAGDIFREDKMTASVVAEKSFENELKDALHI